MDTPGISLQHSRISTVVTTGPGLRVVVPIQWAAEIDEWNAEVSIRFRVPAFDKPFIVIIDGGFPYDWEPGDAQAASAASELITATGSILIRKQEESAIFTLSVGSFCGTYELEWGIFIDVFAGLVQA